MAKLGIEETKDMLKMILCLGSAMGKALEDGKIDFGDSASFLECVYKIGPALKGSELIIAELKDMDPEEKAELHKMIEDDFDIPFDSVESYIETGLKAALSLVDVLKLFGK